METYCIFCGAEFSVLRKRVFYISDINITEFYDFKIAVCDICIEFLFFNTCLNESFSNSGDDLTYSDCEPERYEV